MVVLSENDRKVLTLIRNRLAHGLESPKLREINEVIGKSSPRSAVLALERLEAAGLIERIQGNKIKLVGKSLSETNSASTIEVPLVGLIAAGIPILAQENIEAYISVTTSLAKLGNKYFLLRVVGNSMNEAIIGGVKMVEGSIVLVRQQPTAINGDKVVVLLDDSATVKVFERRDNVVILRPQSNNQMHVPFVLTEDFIIQGVVVAIFPKEILLTNF